MDMSSCLLFELRSDGRCGEMEDVPPCSDRLLGRISNAAKIGPAHCELLDAPSPLRSSPSPVDPFVCFDSAPSTSPSHAVDGSHCLTGDAREVQTQRGSCLSSATASRLPSGSLEMAIDNVCCRRVSLEQHLRHSNVDPEETKHIFILERFLPAAKTIAADHNRTAYSVGMPATMLKFSPVPRPSSTAKMAVDTTTSQLDASKDSATEYLPCRDQDDDNESVNAEMLGKSCGFFWAGLRSAMSCTQNTAHAPSRDSVTKKGTATQLADHRRSLKEDSQPKVKGTLKEDIQRQGGTFVPNLKGLLLSSPSAVKLSQSVSSSSGGYCNDHISKTIDLNSGPLADVCSDCQPNCFPHQIPPSEKQYQSIASSCFSYTHQSFEDCNLCTECHVSENIAHDDGELEFHDASSKLDMLCTQISNSYTQESKSADYQDPSLSAHISASDVSRLFEAHLPLTKGEKPLTDDEGHVKVFQKVRSKKGAKENSKVVNPALASKYNSSCDSHHNSSGFSETANVACMNSYQKNTGHSCKKCLASSLPGWPLGISSLQSVKNKTRSQEAEYVDDIYAATSQLTKTAVEQLRHDRKCPEHLNLGFTHKLNENMKNGKNCNHKKSLSMELLPPPLPPSPTTSSWLGKALALNASKPPTLATLHQQHKVGAVQKMQLSDVSMDEKKGVKWEDIVKRSKGLLSS